ncbi:23S rRNA (uracil(1939)-C(5))-methyltransferase RlmD [Peribacillus muralis]|uniref:23S rRNA (uracil(1939)-C(5))-methyltransferase RlmD n=1 Tax=Peribacillus muralis TaxID=264697 RepID=UPI001F4ECDBA|nr:23S rRNA (uracil(1939)-C(5))-methyltransferase RlmD [Peribacillus muralis]MCK1994009.1 23S rRNA (uracil(1939)-C(5))-methyltransferase RlmD [Peribacillus muralis]MCK2014564.1 23S rRNA (uracil(1939)-C(5))-methyltransferase RlmD [Peribacillus muralis]
MTNIQDTKLEVNQTLPLTIKRLGINGEGVGYFKKKVVFVPGALPGEEIVALVTKVQPNFTEAKIKTIRKESPHRIAAPCPVYAECGGCQLQHLSYDQQLVEKRDIVIQAMERYTKLPVSSLNIKETIGMDDPWNYRNKSQYQVGQKDGKLIAGLYDLNSHTLIDIPNCLVQHKSTNKVTRTVKKILKNLNISIYNERKRKGVIRTVITRVGFETGEVQVVLVTGAEEIPQKDQLLKQIRDQLPEVKSVVQNINNQNTSLIFGEKTIHLAGEKVINETLGDISYELSARTFFQLNPVQTVRMYDEVKKAAALTGTEKVVDAYCGVGTIGLWLSKDAKEVRGMDVIKESIEDAKKNAKKHNRSNMHYETGKAENILPRWIKEGWKPDMLVVDPPRTGCDQALLQTILKAKPKKIVYVSCNPSTLAKDLQELSKIYEVASMQPVDMFPQTSHVECVSELILKEGN